MAMLNNQMVYFLCADLPKIDPETLGLAGLANELRLRP